MIVRSVSIPKESSLRIPSWEGYHTAKLPIYDSAYALWGRVVNNVGEMKVSVREDESSVVQFPFVLLPSQHFDEVFKAGY